MNEIDLKILLTSLNSWYLRRYQHCIFNNYFILVLPEGILLVSKGSTHLHVG